MGQVLSSMKASMVEDVVSSITANTAKYYAFVANPVTHANGVPTETLDTKTAYNDNNWKLILGKRLTNTDIVPVINNITWTTNTAYGRYDNTQDLSNSNFFVVTTPAIVGGFYHVFKCIDNANGVASTVKPDQVQATSFTKSDGYTWRYIYSISTANYKKFATDGHIPVYSNATVVSSAYTYSGVEVVPIANSGSGYSAYHSGIIRSKPSSSILQIENSASVITNFYQNNAIYITNNNSPTSQLLTISSYVSNVTGNWVILESAANTDIITPGITEYLISPRVKFDTDGEEAPEAYTVVSNTTNSIANVVVIDTGYGITRATATVITSTVAPPITAANIYCIVPPPGGHGSHPASELNAHGLGVAIMFSGNEGSTIPTNISYNVVGILKNPYSLTANGTKGAAYSQDTFDALLVANVSDSMTYSVGTTVTGITSKAKGVVAFSNTSQVFLIGDKSFQDEEQITNTGGNTCTIFINTLGDIYTKDLRPLYYRNVDDVSRDNTQVESFKLIVQYNDQ